MKVILLKPVKNLGNFGAEVEVRDGYGRNFLIPMKHALPANKVNKKVFDENRDKLLKEHQASLSEADNVAVNLKGKWFTIVKNSNADGILYGSISKNDIFSAFKLDELNKNIPEGKKLILDTKNISINTSSIKK